jgi:uncharacterized protein (TIGR02246 family)
MKRLITVAVAALLATPAALAQEAADAPPAEASPAAPIEAALREYVTTFNSNDAAKLAARWAPQGVYANKTTGERTAGREALQSDFAALFEESPGVRLMGQVESVRLIRPDVAAADGQATVVFPGGDASQTNFSAVLIKEGEEWLLDSIHEADLPSPETPYEALADLEWMIGHWVDQSEDAQVDTVVRWSPNRAFLLRSFSVQLPDEDPKEGTQVVGWDPNRKEIRSWSFSSDGSFGEATWSQNDGDWLIRATQTLADGRLATWTQAITRVDENTMSVQLLARTIDGEPAAALDPVLVVRVDEPPLGEPTPAEEAAPEAPAKAPAAPPATSKAPAATPRAPGAPPAAPSKAPAAPSARPAAPAAQPAAPARTPAAPSTSPAAPARAPAATPAAPKTPAATPKKQGA